MKTIVTFFVCFCTLLFIGGACLHCQPIAVEAESCCQAQLRFQDSTRINATYGKSAESRFVLHIGEIDLEFRSLKTTGQQLIGQCMGMSIVFNDANIESSSSGTLKFVSGKFNFPFVIEKESSAKAVDVSRWNLTSGIVLDALTFSVGSDLFFIPDRLRPCQLYVGDPKTGDLEFVANMTDAPERKASLNLNEYSGTVTLVTSEPMHLPWILTGKLLKYSY